MDNIIKLIKEELDGTGITDLQIQSIAGVYLLGTLKNQIELLTGFSKKDPGFMQRLVDFVSREISTLTSEERDEFNKQVDLSSQKLLIDLIVTFKKSIVDNHDHLSVATLTEE